MAEAPLYLGNFNEFMLDLKQAPDRYARKMRGVFRTAATEIATLAGNYAPKKTGAMAQNTSIRVNQWSVKITWIEVYAGVQEFGVEYPRRTTTGGMATVHLTGSTPRYAYRAWEELKPNFEDKLMDALAEAVAEGGFWELS
jgi:hypothetical protein